MGLDSAKLLWKAVRGNAKGEGTVAAYCCDLFSASLVRCKLLQNVLLLLLRRIKVVGKVAYIGEKSEGERAQPVPDVTDRFINFLLFQSCPRIH